MSEQSGEAKADEPQADRGVEAFARAHARLLTLGVLAVALGLRAADYFGWWLNPDEGIYFGAVALPGFGAFWEEVLRSAHPPLYFVLLRGAGALTLSFSALRLPALLSGLAAVWLLVEVGRETGGSRVHPWSSGLAAGLLLALAPRAVVLSDLIRPYMLLVVLLAASLLLLLRWLDAPRGRLLAGYAACATAAVLTHYSAVLGLAALGALALFEGVRRRLGRRAWLGLGAAHAPSAFALAVLYFVHLRSLMAGWVAENATQGWLGSFMIRSPRDAWTGLVGFHTMLVGPALAPAAALATLGALVLAARRRAWVPLALASAALLIGGLAAALQLYPLGATRHTSWLLVFVTPLLGWAAAELLTAGRRSALASVSAAALIGLTGWAMGGLPGGAAVPPEISERVLRRAGLEAMRPALDPSAPPGVVFMSTETYQLLTPLFAEERLDAHATADGVLTHFTWGARDVVVLPSRDFAAAPGALGAPNHLLTAAERATAELPGVAVTPSDTVLVLAGGWRSEGVAELARLSERGGALGTTASVPGLIAVYLDLGAYLRALSLPAPVPNAPPTP